MKNQLIVLILLSFANQSLSMTKFVNADTSSSRKRVRAELWMAKNNNELFFLVKKIPNTDNLFGFTLEGDKNKYYFSENRIGEGEFLYKNNLEKFWVYGKSVRISDVPNINWAQDYQWIYAKDLIRIIQRELVSHPRFVRNINGEEIKISNRLINILNINFLYSFIERNFSDNTTISENSAK